MAYSGRDIFKALKAGLGYPHVRLGWGVILGGLTLALAVALLTRSDIGLGLVVGPLVALPFVIFHHGRMVLKHLKSGKG